MCSGRSIFNIKCGSMHRNLMFIARVIQMHSLMIVMTCVVVGLYLTSSVEVCIVTSANYMII